MAATSDMIWADTHDASHTQHPTSPDQTVQLGGCLSEVIALAIAVES